jgi:SPASM domain peptide maturase of grasp-with-spasm system
MEYILFSCCKITNGANRSIITDTQRKSFFCLPIGYSNYFKNSVIDFEGIEELTFEEISEFKHFLISEEIIFELPSNIDKDCFTTNHINNKCLFDKRIPAKITNAIINITFENAIYVYSNFNILTNILGCNHIEFRLMDIFNLEELKQFIVNISKFNMDCFSIYANFHKEFTTNNLRLINTSIGFKIMNITIYNNQEINNIEYFNLINEGNYGNIFFISNKILNICCGYIENENMVIHENHFLESQHHNTCLNRKISIDEHGEIKNCPSMAKSYGNIRDTKLIDVVNNPEFQKMWHIKKDDITKCKDCEFRHICTDCRAYIENPDDIYSAPLKCGYDPYTGVWEEWSTNPLKEKAIEFYGMQDLVVRGE